MDVVFLSLIETCSVSPGRVLKHASSNRLRLHIYNFLSVYGFSFARVFLRQPFFGKNYRNGQTRIYTVLMR